MTSVAAKPDMLNTTCITIVCNREWLAKQLTVFREMFDVCIIVLIIGPGPGNVLMYDTSVPLISARADE